MTAPHEETQDALDIPNGWRVDRISTMPDGQTVSVRVVCDIPGVLVGAITGFGMDQRSAVLRAIEAIPAQT